MPKSTTESPVSSINESHVEIITSQLALSFKNRSQLPDEHQILKLAKTRAMEAELLDGIKISEEEQLRAVRTLQARFVHSMTIGTIFSTEDYIPWLADRQGSINWYYSRRYFRHLVCNKGFPNNVVGTMESITDTVLDRMENPLKEGEWRRKGLVVGHVQSGKTANYTGLICKAADAGYKVIIVLAGILNSLRSQTQERLDHDFAGYCTKLEQTMGAANMDTGSGAPRRPIFFTSAEYDFHKNKIPALTLDSLSEPVVFVIKKNSSILKNLYNWLSKNNTAKTLGQYPMLMIDDEADHASINVNSEDLDPTVINARIRDILSLFRRNCYVGYTATPFANIFINPDTAEEMGSEDLFPKDFILSLDPPSNYVGPERIFTEIADLEHCVQHIEDNADVFPERHKIGFRPDAKTLPKSLTEALHSFILAKAVRLHRGQLGKHHSMLINVSRFTGVQNHLKAIVHNLLGDLRQAIGNHSALPENEALKDSTLHAIKTTWDKRFPGLDIQWSDIQRQLKASVDPMQVICVNGKTSDSLDYNRKDWPNGRSLIAIGGLSLSRGLTLEGLLVSYFLRNSMMYDTLMQMGRWFGYRDGYEDVCKVFMTPEAHSWYAHIADSTEELRQEFKRMERNRKTPAEFGLRVRTHPSALIVTARNKMKTGKVIPVNISLEGRLVETSVVCSDKKSVDANTRTLHELIANAIQEKGQPEKISSGYFWRGVSVPLIKETLENYKNHEECLSTYTSPLISFLEELEAKDSNTCDILLKSVRESAGKPEAEPCVVQVNGLEVVCPKRTVDTFDDRKIVFAKRRVASRGDEKAGICDEEIAKLKIEGDKNIPDHVYRKHRKQKGMPPLFMINLIDARFETSDGGQENHLGIIPCFGISFPGDRDSCDLGKTVSYMVNTQYWREQYLDTDTDEDEQEN